MKEGGNDNGFNLWAAGVLRCIVRLSHIKERALEWEESDIRRKRGRSDASG